MSFYNFCVYEDINNHPQHYLFHNDNVTMQSKVWTNYPKCSLVDVYIFVDPVTTFQSDMSDQFTVHCGFAK